MINITHGDIIHDVIWQIYTIDPVKSYERYMYFFFTFLKDSFELLVHLVSHPNSQSKFTGK